MWNIAHNLGGFAAPILAGTAARTLGWSVSFVSFRDASVLQLKCVFLEKWGLWAPGIIALFVGSLIMLTLKDSPEARGFSPVEQITGGPFANLVLFCSRLLYQSRALSLITMNLKLKSRPKPRCAIHLAGFIVVLTQETFFSMKVENKSLLDNLFRNVLSNPFIWLGQCSSFC